MAKTGEGRLWICAWGENPERKSGGQIHWPGGRPTLTNTLEPTTVLYRPPDLSRVVLGPKRWPPPRPRRRSGKEGLVILSPLTELGKKKGKESLKTNQAISGKPLNH